ncbi:MAG: hypothetical protein ABL985_17385 [Casimicrobium sp.]
MAEVSSHSQPTHAHSRDDSVALTPPGVVFAFANAVVDATCTQLQSVLIGGALPTVNQWLNADVANSEILARGLKNGWLQIVSRRLTAPNVKLDDFLPVVIAGLSGERRAALASSGGFCVGHSGYTQDEAEALCAAAADFTEFARRQQARGWDGANRMVSFHEDAAMLIPSVSFVPFWVDGVDYCLVLAGEPLINNPAFVELVWGIKAAGSRFVRDA